MKAEIIAIGSELLLGEVVNTNATWLSEELAKLGIDVYYHTTVGDNPKRIHGVIETALSRSNLLIFTGGLGPTDDDITIATIGEFLNTPLISDSNSEEAIKNYFIARGMSMSHRNVKQALKPEGAETISNPVGTAPGIYWDLSQKLEKPTFILCFPGVPKELYAMWEQGKGFLNNHLSQNGQKPTQLYSESLHFFGIGESKLGELLSDLMQGENPTVAPYVSKAEVRIRIAAKASSKEEASEIIQPVKEAVLARAEQFCYGENNDTLESMVGKMLRDNNLTVSIAESCTGGLVSSRLTDVPGSSEYIHLNLVTYSNEQKTKELNVSPNTLITHGAVSPETAAQMAQGVREKSGADIGIALTGIAGPEGGSEEKPVGLVYIGLSGLGDEPFTKKVLVNPNYGRVDIKFWFSQYALHYLRLYLLKQLEPDATQAKAGSI